MNEQSYFLRLLVWIDNGLNVSFSPVFNYFYKTDKFGDPDECISSILGKLKIEGKDTKFRAAVDWVFLKCFKQENHCVSNIEADEGKKVN